MPIASIADAIVFAVYIPPHAPAPGHACSTISRRLFSSIDFAEELTIRLERRNDIELLAVASVSGANRSTVDHQRLGG